MLNNFLVPEEQNFADYNQKTCFQHDGTTFDTSNNSLPRVREIAAITEGTGQAVLRKFISRLKECELITF